MRRCPGVEVCRCEGVHVRRYAGVQFCLRIWFENMDSKTGIAVVQVSRCAGMQVYKCAGVKVCRRAGLPVCGCEGAQGLMCNGFCSGFCSRFCSRFYFHFGIACRSPQDLPSVSWAGLVGPLRQADPSRAVGETEPATILGGRGLQGSNWPPSPHKTKKTNLTIHNKITNSKQ